MSSNFVVFTSTDIVGRQPSNQFQGNQNTGFQIVRFADGSFGIEKSLKDWVGNKTGRMYPAELLASQEWLASRVGQALGAPVRDCHFTSKDGTTVIMPFIVGQTGKELGGKDVPDDEQGTALRLFDYLVANSDRRPKNLMFTSNGIVGIDHALCNFRPRTPSPELLSALWNGGVTSDYLRSLEPVLSTTKPHFESLQMVDKYENMMFNLIRLVADLQVIENGVNSVVKSGQTFTPPQGVQDAAKKALEWMKDGKAGDGFTPVGRKRASDLARGATVSEDTIRRMKAYFDRHQPDKKSPHWDEPSPGKVAWYAWGGDAGYSWAKSVVERLNKVQKGDLPGHDFHGNQWTEGIPEGWSLGSHDDKTFTLTSDKGNTAIFSKSDSLNGGWSPDTAKRILSVVDGQSNGKTVDFRGNGSYGGEFARVPLDNPNTIVIGSKAQWDGLIKSRGDAFASQIGEKANDPQELSLAMRRYDAIVAKKTDYGSENKYGDNFVSPIGITKAIITHELGHSIYMTGNKTVSDLYTAVSKVTGISTGDLAKSEADGYKFLGARKDLFGNTAMQITGNTVKTDGVSYDKNTAFAKWGLAPLSPTISSALKKSGMTSYGSKNLAEMTAEAYAMFQNTNITPSPLTQSLADTLGWTRPTAKSVVEKGDLPGHEFHGNQWVAVSLEELTNKVEQDHPDVKLDISEKNGNISLSRIVVPKESRNSGVGTAIMRHITNYADSKGMTVSLTPSTEYGGKKSGLERFYRNLGFVPNKGRTADLRISDSWIRRNPVEKGDLPGHAFHGNQYTEAQVANAAQKLHDIIEKNQSLKPADLQTVARIHESIAIMHKSIGGKVHEEAAVQHQLAAKNMIELSKKVKNALESPDDKYLPQEGGKWLSDRTGELLSTKEMEERITQSTAAGAALSAAGPRAIRMSLSACKRSVAMGGDTVQKGDFEGHPFRGNQWERFGVKADGISPSSSAETPVDMGLPKGWSIDSKKGNRITLKSEAGNSAVFSTKGSWKTGDPMTHNLLTALDAHATGKTLNFAPKDITRGLSGALAYVGQENPNTIEMMPKSRMDSVVAKQANFYGSDPALTALHDSLPKSTEAGRYHATFSMFATPEKIGEAVICHELGHSDFFSKSRNIGSVYDAISKTLGLDRSEIERSERVGYGKMLGKASSWDLEGKTVGRTEAVDWLLKNKQGIADLHGTALETRLRDAGITSYGASNLQETVAEAHAMFSMPELPKSPLVIALAESFGWGVQKAVGSKSMDISLKTGIADGPNGPALIIGDMMYDYATKQWSPAWEPNPELADEVEKGAKAKWLKLLNRENEARKDGDEDKADQIHYQVISSLYDEDEVKKGDFPGHPFRGNQFQRGVGMDEITAWQARRAGVDTPTEPKPADKGGFVGLKTTEIDKTLTNREKWGGAMNRGFDTVRLKDGSIGVVKHNDEPSSADNEVLSARIGKAMGVPIRDAEFVKGGQPNDTLHPYIEGKACSEITAEERKAVGDSADMKKIEFLDMITGNPDRHWGNIMMKPDKSIVGIDGGNAFASMPSPKELRNFVTKNKVDPALVASAHESIQGLFKMKDLTPYQQNIVVNEVAPMWQSFWDNGGETYAKTGSFKP